jgi:murein DD-endopeptidase MepM/ murein hydrolase activator NlpD
MQRIAPALSAGARIAQGELVGTVGITGWTTGPHLHFELKVNGGQVNPMTASLPAAQPLPVAELIAFHAAASPLREQLALLERVDVALSAGR